MGNQCGPSKAAINDGPKKDTSKTLKHGEKALANPDTGYPKPPQEDPNVNTNYPDQQQENPVYKPEYPAYTPVYPAPQPQVANYGINNMAQPENKNGININQNNCDNNAIIISSGNGDITIRPKKE